MSALPARAETPPALLSPRFVRLTVANFCFFLTFASYFLLPLHVRALGGSERTVGFVMGTLGIAGLAGILLVGPLLDRWPRHLFFRGGLIGMALLSLGFLAVDRVGPLLFALRVLQGLAFAAGFNAASTMAVEFSPPARRGAALGLFGVSTLATHALAPTIGEEIIRIGGFRWLFGAAALYSTVGLAIAWTLPAGRVLPRDGAAHLRLDRRLRMTFLATACCGIAFGTVITFTPTFVQDEHLGRVATFFLSYTAAAILTRAGAGGLGDAFGYRRVAIPALLGLGVAIASLATVHSVLALGLAGVGFGTAQGFAFPTLNAFTVQGVPPGHLGRVQTFFNGAFNLGVTFGSIALGNVVELAGHRAGFLCGALLAFTSAAIFAAGTGRARTR